MDLHIELNMPALLEHFLNKISLIKQPNIANDEICKIVINMLYAALHKVMTESYGSACGQELPHGPPAHVTDKLLFSKCLKDIQ
jgi:hypothetical protein